MKNCFDPKEFSGSDIEKINAALLIPGALQDPIMDGVLDFNSETDFRHFSIRKGKHQKSCHKCAIERVISTFYRMNKRSTLDKEIF